MESEDGGVVKLLWLWHAHGRTTSLPVRFSAALGSWLQVATVRISAHAAVRAVHQRRHSILLVASVIVIQN